MARSRIMRVFGLLLPLAAYIILGYTWYVYNVRLCGYELIGSGRIGQAIAYLIPMNIFFILSTWSYFRAIVVPPGSPNRPYTTNSDHSPILPLNAPSFSDRGVVPSYSPTKFDMNTFEPKQSDESTTLDVAAPAVSLCKQNGQPRYCEKCQSVKPDRTHHCSECDECVLKMDHHCPWVNGCVGFRNYKYFLLFVSYTALYALFGLATTLPVVVYSFERVGLGFDFHLIILDILAVLFGMLLTAFAGIHIYYTLNNTTTIEAIADQPYHVKVELPVGSQVVVTGFGERLWSLGSLRKNWESVMGRVWWKWFLPLDTTPGTGLTFPYHPGIYSRLVSEAEQEIRMPALMVAPEAEDSYSEPEYRS